MKKTFKNKHILVILLVIAVLGTWLTLWPFERSQPPTSLISTLPVTKDPQPTLDLPKVAAPSPKETPSLPPNFWFASANAAPPETKKGSDLSPTDIESLAKEQLRQLAPKYQLNPDTLSGARLHHVHDVGSGPIVAKFNQYGGDLEIFRNELNLLFDRNQQLIAVSGHLSPHVAAMEQQGGPERLRELNNRFQLSVETAIALAFKGMGGTDSKESWKLDHTQDGYLFYVGSFDNVDYRPRQPARVKKVLFDGEQELIPAYYIEIMAGEFDVTKSDAYSQVISAKDGQVLFKNNLKSHASAFTYRVFAHEDGDHAPMNSPLGDAGVPNLSGGPSTPPTIPSPVAQTRITLQNGPISTNDPWLDDLATTTKGNNVESNADINNTQFKQALSNSQAPVSAHHTFDYTFSNNMGPFDTNAQGLSTIVQLFYTLNYLHDLFYDAGFDEKAGNAQQNNYGRGGNGGDPLVAQLLDNADGRDNASIVVAADGSSPQMQMSLWSGSSAIGVTVNQPGNMTIAKVGRASFGPSVFTLTGQVVRLMDGVDPVKDACQTPVNASFVRGKIALIDRGLCLFVDKVRTAQAAGAIGVIVSDNKVSSTVFTMAGEDTSITIPSVLVMKKDGDALDQQLLNGPVNVTLSRKQANDRVGSMDTMVVAHEWGHFISERLIGNGNGVTNNQGGGLEEGWGDFHALFLAVHEEQPSGEGKAYQGVYPAGSYVLSNSPEMQPYYFGLRRVPYSVDFTKNALTFKHIQSGVSLPTVHPVQDDGSDNAEVHNAGEIWATMLWEAYAALLQDTPRLSFAQAKERMKRYLVASYKMTPADPTFTEARDALLSVVNASDQADHQLMKAAFARRGLGINAVSPTRYSMSHAGLKESYDVHEPMRVVKTSLVPVTGLCDPDGVLDAGETARLTMVLTNDGLGISEPLTVTLTSTNDVKFANGGVISFPSAKPGEIITGVVDVTLNTAQPFALFKVNPDFSLPVSNATPDLFTWVINHDLIPAYKQDLLGKPGTDWLFANGKSHGSDTWSIQNDATDGKLLYVGLDPDHQADFFMISPEIQVAATGSFRFRFDHRYAFEQNYVGRWDGGVLEISADHGPWVDLGTFITPGYNGTILSTNPILPARKGFTGISNGYPTLITESVDLGQAYNGRAIRLRYRIGSDERKGERGWMIRNLFFENITNLPFTAMVANRVSCPVPTPTTPKAGTHGMTGILRGVNAGEKVQLMAISSLANVQKKVDLVGNGGDLLFFFEGLPPASDYRLEVTGDHHWNGYWVGQPGGEAQNAGSKSLSSLVDLSLMDQFGINLRVVNRAAVVKPDQDGDGWTDDIDNCPNLADPEQLDRNGNGVGDRCESTVGVVSLPGGSDCKDVSGKLVEIPHGSLCASLTNRRGDVAPYGAADGRLDISDAVVALRISMELIDGVDDAIRSLTDISPLCIKASQTCTKSGDGQIDISDAVVILRLSLQLINPSEVIWTLPSMH